MKMLKAGFARLDMTPPLGEDLGGYYYRRLADGVLDPLEIVALAVSDGEETVVMLSLDCMAITNTRAKTFLNMISERTGVPTDHIHVSALHPHTGPHLTEAGAESRLEAIDAMRDKTYNDVLNRRVADAAQLAIADLKDATVRVGAQQTAREISFVRRYFTKEKGVVTNPSSKLTLLGRCSESDNTMRLVRFVREGANDIALVNFSTHPDTLGLGKANTKWSADWPGFTRRFVESDLENVSCIFFTGCQGDTNHVDRFTPEETRWPEGPSYAHTRYMGRTVADAVIDAWDKTTPVVADRVQATHRTVYTRTNTDGLENYDACKKWCEGYENDTLPPEEKNMENMAYSYRIVGLRSEPIFRPIPMSFISIGDVLLVGFGGEAFTAYGKAMRELCPDKFVVSTVCTNGYAGYFPTAEAFEQGGYEACSSFFLPTVEKEILDAAKDAVKNF